MALRLFIILAYLLSGCGNIDKRTRPVDPLTLEPGDRVVVDLLSGDHIEGEFESVDRDSIAIVTDRGTEALGLQSVAEVRLMKTVHGVKPVLYVLTTLLVLMAVVGFGLSGVAPAST